MSEHTSDSASHPLLRVEQLKEHAEEIKKKREQERVHCPECGTTVWKDSVEQAVETAEKHDESRHDGKATTQVNGIVPSQFTEQEKEQIRDAVEAMHADATQEAHHD